MTRAEAARRYRVGIAIGAVAGVGLGLDLDVDGGVGDKCRGREWCPWRSAAVVVGSGGGWWRWMVNANAETVATGGETVVCCARPTGPTYPSMAGWGSPAGSRVRE